MFDWRYEFGILNVALDTMSRYITQAVTADEPGVRKANLQVARRFHDRLGQQLATLELEAEHQDKEGESKRPKAEKKGRKGAAGNA